jgi:predicted DNA-binding protein (UPF0251 family)
MAIDLNGLASGAERFKQAIQNRADQQTLCKLQLEVARLLSPADPENRHGTGIIDGDTSRIYGASLNRKLTAKILKLQRTIPAAAFGLPDSPEWAAAVSAIDEFLRTQRPKTRRRPRTLRSQRELTPNEVEAMRVVALHKRNFSAAARELGKDSSTVREQYNNALAKLGQKSKEKFKESIRPLPRDHRGQANIAAKPEAEPDLD